MFEGGDNIRRLVGHPSTAVGQDFLRVGRFFLMGSETIVPGRDVAMLEYLCASFHG